MAQVILGLRFWIAETADGPRHCGLQIDDCRLSERKAVSCKPKASVDCRLAERMRTADSLRPTVSGPFLAPIPNP